MQDSFLNIACIGLGALAGTLIALPYAMHQAAIPGPLLVGGGTAFGFFVGYRRRNSRVFLYFSLVSILVLLILLVGATVPLEQES